jgi:hypothetical protein
MILLRIKIFNLLKKRIGEKDKPLPVEEIRAGMSIHFKRLNMKSTKMRRMKNYFYQ